jgi:ACS family hexuronate transporter-like MFS transporter
MKNGGQNVHAWLVAIAATVAMSISYADRQIVAAIGSSLRAALGLDAEHFGWLAGSFSGAYLVAVPFAGVVLDRVGARRGLAAAVVVWSLVSAMHAAAPSFAALVAARVALAAAESPSFPAAAQAVRRVVPLSQRRAGFGLLFTGSSLGAAFVGPLALALDLRFGYRAAFLLTSLLGMTWLPAWLWITRTPAIRMALDLRRAGAERAPIGAPGAFDLIRQPAVIRAIALVFAAAPGLMFILLWLPQYLQLEQHVAKSELGKFVWVPTMMADVGMVGFGVLASRSERRTTRSPSLTALVLFAASLEAAMVLAPRASGGWSATALLGISAMGGGGLYTLLTGEMMDRVHPARSSTAAGVTAAMQSLIYFVLNPVVGRWVDRAHSFDGPLVLLGALALPGALVWVAFGKSTPTGP